MSREVTSRLQEESRMHVCTSCRETASFTFRRIIVHAWNISCNVFDMQLWSCSVHNDILLVLSLHVCCEHYASMHTISIEILYPYGAMHLVLILKQVSSAPQGCIYILKIMFSMIIRETVLRKLINIVQKFGIIYNKLSVSKDIYNITKGLSIQINAVLNFILICELWKIKCITVSTKILSSTTVFNIDNNQKCSEYNDFWRSCDTEDCSNDAENTV